LSGCSIDRIEIWYIQERIQKDITDRLSLLDLSTTFQNNDLGSSILIGWRKVSINIDQIRSQ